MALFVGCVSFSQEMVNAIPIEFKKDKAAFQVVNKATKQVVLFFGDKTSVSAIRLDAKMQLIDSLSVPRPEKDYDRIVGYNYNAENTRLFWASSNYEQIYSQAYSFEKRAVSGEKQDINFKGEVFLSTFSKDERFYIMSVVKRSNKLKLYVFDNDGKMEQKIIDLGAARFFVNGYEPANIDDALYEITFPMQRSYGLQKISAENPTPLTESSKKKKCYLIGKQIFITLDANADFTNIVTIDLDTYTATTKAIQQSYISFVNRDDLSGNSFINDGKLYQFKVSSEEMFFTIKDLQGNLIKEYNKKHEDLLDFRNSEILEENGNPDKPRILEKTAQFIRKSYNQNLGLSVSNSGENQLVTLGSISNDNPSTAMTIGGMFGVVGVLVAYMVSNPTLENFNPYNHQVVMYVNCLFDKNGSHLEGKLKPPAFDNMRKFLIKQQNISSSTLFKLDGYYYLGYYSKADKKYFLQKFEE